MLLHDAAALWQATTLSPSVSIFEGQLDQRIVTHIDMKLSICERGRSEVPGHQIRVNIF
jgi:hypothetical protein